MGDLTYYNVLLVEDDKRLSALIGDYLSSYEFNVTYEYRGDLAVDRIIKDTPDLIILDLMLPGLNGLDVCRQIRSQFPGPILMLTAQIEDVDQVVGLEIGADDYVNKPVEPRVLLARIRSLLRRVSRKCYDNSSSTTLLEGEHITINAASREVILSGTSIRLTTSEFDLLWYLASQAGKIICREDLYQSLCGIEYDGLDRSMDIRISKLRKLLNDDSDHPSLIKTVRGKGYLFSLVSSEIKK